MHLVAPSATAVGQFRGQLVHWYVLLVGFYSPDDVQSPIRAKFQVNTRPTILNFKLSQEALINKEANHRIIYPRLLRSPFCGGHYGDQVDIRLYWGIFAKTVNLSENPERHTTIPIFSASGWPIDIQEQQEPCNLSFLYDASRWMSRRPGKKRRW